MASIILLTALTKVTSSLYEQIQSLKFNRKSLILLHEKIAFLSDNLKKIPEEKLEVNKLEKVLNLIKDVDFWVRTRLVDRNLMTQMLDAPIILKTIERYDNELLFYLQLFHIDLDLEQDLKAAHKVDLEELKNDLTAKMNNQNARMDQVLNDLCISRNQEVSSMYAISQIMDQNLIQSNKLDKLLQYLQQRSGRHIKRKLKFTSIPWHEIKLDYQQPIGRGSYGEVYKGKWEGYEVAIKQSLNEVVGNDSVLEIERELNNWFPIRHPNVACLWGGFLNSDKPYLVMKFYKHGSASDFLLRHKPPTSVRIQFILDIAQGMNHLHLQHSLIHGDLKGDNVLIDEVDFNYRCVITDFGLSRLRNCNSSVQTGATRWIAPERYDVSRTHDRTKLDVFAYAMTAYQLLLSEFPWPREMDSTIITKLICEGKRPEPYSENSKRIYEEVDKGVWALIEDCWNQDPAKRPGFGEIVTRLKDIMAHRKLNESIMDLEADIVPKEVPMTDSGVCQVAINPEESVKFPEPITPLTLSSSSTEKERLKEMNLKCHEHAYFIASSSPSIDKEDIAKLKQNMKIKSKSADYDFEFNTPILRSRLSKMDLTSGAKQLPVPLVNKGIRQKPSLFRPQQTFVFETPMLAKKASYSRMGKPSLLPPKVGTVMAGSRMTQGVKISLNLSVNNFGQNVDFLGSLRQDNGSPEKVTGFIRSGNFNMTLTSRPMNFGGIVNYEGKVVTGKWYSLGYSGEFEMSWR